MQVEIRSGNFNNRVAPFGNPVQVSGVAKTKATEGTNLNVKRIKRALKKSFTEARLAIARAREYPSAFAIKVALETVAHIRRTNADRRRALRLGTTVSAGTIG